MERLNCEILIGKYRFDYVQELSIESSWDLFTDKCRIVLPNKFRRENKNIIGGFDNVFKRGDAVSVKLGYYPSLKTEFTGYVSKITPDSPMIIECEDEMWILKQRNIPSKSWKNPTIQEVIEYCLGDLKNYITVEYLDPNIKLGEFVIDNKNYANIVQVFEEIKKTHNILSYFVDKKLYIGTVNLFGEGDIFKFGFQNNIISSGLEYRRNDDIRLVVKGINFKDDNTKEEIYGFYLNDKIQFSTKAVPGELRTITKFNYTSKQLKEEIERMMPLLIYEGYFGSFETFGAPSLNFFDKVELFDKKFPERKGTYTIKAINKIYGINGYRQNVSLHLKG